MKTVIVLTSAVLMFFINSSALFGQDSIRYSTPARSLPLNGASGEQEVKLAVRDSLSYINFEIKASLTTGKLTVGLFDPNGDKYGNFSIAASAGPGEKQETEIVRGKTYIVNASGSLVRYVKFPVRGLWKARVITKNATGFINFNLTREVVVIKKY